MIPTPSILVVADGREECHRVSLSLGRHRMSGPLHAVWDEAGLAAAPSGGIGGAVLVGEIGWQDVRRVLDSVRQRWPHARTLQLFSAAGTGTALTLLHEERTALALPLECDPADLRTAVELLGPGGWMPAGAGHCAPCVGRHPLGFFRCLPAGRILDGNAALARLLGYANRAQLLLAAPRLWPGGTKPGEDGVGSLCDLALPHREGKPCWGRLLAQPVRDRSSAVIAFEGWVENAGRLHVFQAALRRIHQRYRRLLDALPIPIGIGNREGIVVDGNAALERLSGYKLAEIVGKKRIQDFVVEPHRPLLLKYHQMRHAGQAPPKSYEFGFLCRSGEIRQMRLTACHLPDEARTIAVGEDLTDHVRRERGLKLLATALTRVGPEVFPALAISLCTGLEAAGVLIGRVPNLAATTIEILAAARDGRPDDLPSFSLAGSVCESLVRGHRLFIHHARGARAQYPHDTWLAQTRAEAFTGIPLVTPDGRRLGVIAVAHRHPSPSIRFCKTLLQLAASRIAAELERRPGPAHDRERSAQPSGRCDNR